MSVVVLPLQREPEVLGRSEAPLTQLTMALQIAPREGLRLLRHPVFVASLLLLGYQQVTIATMGPQPAFHSLVSAPTFFAGVLVFFAANLTATRARRSRSEELLEPLPGDAQGRTLGLCLGALAPALLVQVTVLLAYAYTAATDLWVQDPTLAHLVQGPVTVLGGALLGIMVARWAPYTGVAVVVMVAMIAFDVWVANRPHLAPLGTYMNWASYGSGEGWYGFEPGDAHWHVTYLALLCAMALTGALLRSSRRPLLVLAVGAALTVGAVAAGFQAVP
jgi:hypothetical protein